MSLSRNEFLEQKVREIVAQADEVAELWTGTLMADIIKTSRKRLVEVSKTHNRTLIYPVLGKLRKQLAEASYEMR